MKEKFCCKRLAALVVCGLMFSLAAACAAPDGGKNDGGDEEQKLLTVEEIMSQYSAASLKCDKYSLTKYTKPYWASQIIYNETVCFYEDEGAVADKKLMYHPAKILEVRSYDLNTLYAEGTDYEMTEEGLRYIEGSSIPTTNFDYYYLDAPLDANAAFRSEKYPEKYVAYEEFARFPSKTVCVTYIRTEEWSGPEQPYSEKLSVLEQKLEKKENVTLLFYGDSIMEGCNASGFRNIEPKMPRFSDLVTKKLSSYYGYNGDTKITAHNTAVGGWLSSTGVERWKKQNDGIVPDLLVLHFGCNDGTFSASPVSVTANLRNMINKALALNPDCAIIVFSSTIPNTDAYTSETEAVVRKFYNNQDVYEDYFCDLANEFDHAFCVKVTTFQKWLLERKDFIDISASNISHPNDFFARYLAQAILSAIIKNYN